MDYQKVKAAIEKGGSIRAAAELLNVAYQSLQWWLATNGYAVEKRAYLVKRKPKKLPPVVLDEPDGRFEDMPE